MARILEKKTSTEGKEGKDEVEDGRGEVEGKEEQGARGLIRRGRRRQVLEAEGEEEGAWE